MIVETDDNTSFADKFAAIKNKIAAFQKRQDTPEQECKTPNLTLTCPQPMVTVSVS
jgi:hypothetical protein